MIHAARNEADAIVINPAGFSFHSIPVLDALKAFEGPVVEVHISNIHSRDELHRHSIISTVSKGVICGAGTYGYILGHAGRRPHAGQAPRHPARAHPAPARNSTRHPGTRFSACPGPTAGGKHPPTHASCHGGPPGS